MTNATATVTKLWFDDELDKPARTEGIPTGEHQRIGEMLTYRRAHDSDGEMRFIEKYILPLNPVVIDDRLEVMAYVVTIPGTEEQNARAFCAHTDSVHNRTFKHERQTVGFDAVRREFFVNDPKQRDCLGADDAAGVYILVRMIEAQVPGMYVFFRGEERGGIGSDYVTENRRDLFAGITQAIQFDRRGTESIITEMACGRTCSDMYAEALGRALAMGHQSDPTGSFTDTANLAEIVPECTNISVGYEWEHSARETLDSDYLVALADACITAFSDTDMLLPIAREAGQFRDTKSRKHRSSVYNAEDFSIEIPYYGELSVFDLPELTERDLEFLADTLTTSEFATLLKGAAQALVYAYPDYYDSAA